MVAQGSKPGDFICLYGEIGSGKTVFCRYFIRKLIKDDTIVVTSPTFVLEVPYKIKNSNIVVRHIDLYRLSGPNDAKILNLDQNFTNSIFLIEWSDRLQQQLPKSRLDVKLEFVTEIKNNSMEETLKEKGEPRKVILTGYGRKWATWLKNFH